MPFIPHTGEDVRAMLDAIGAGSIEELFDEIPKDLRAGSLEGVPPGLGEMEVARLMSDLAARDGHYTCFLGAGAYEHHVPAAVWEITTRGEYYSAYTPYQAEASQGTLQVVYEFQTMMSSLTGLEVSNASLYDGASGLAEAVLMAVRVQKRSRRILMPATVHPLYRRVTDAIVRSQRIEITELPYDPDTGTVPPASLDEHAGDDVAALVVPMPNYFGGIEDVDALTDWAAERSILVIALVNPVALALLKPPGQWGGDGADIAVGEGQPLGVPLSGGGPYFGFMCCRSRLARQMPGRICGRTVDVDGRAGYTLTLQAREQHIRRSKATSNICTNQGLMVTAATIHMAILGPEGLRRVAAGCHANTRRLIERLCAIDGVERVFDASFFHEAALRLPWPVEDVMSHLAGRGILGGLALGRYYEELGDAILVCATEMRTGEDIESYAEALRDL